MEGEGGEGRIEGEGKGRKGGVKGKGGGKKKGKGGRVVSQPKRKSVCATDHSLLDQKLTSCRYSSCSSCSCCCSCSFWGDYLPKCLRLRRFKSDWGEIWRECSSKYMP